MDQATCIRLANKALGTSCLRSLNLRWAREKILESVNLKTAIARSQEAWRAEKHLDLARALPRLVGSLHNLNLRFPANACSAA